MEKKKSMTSIKILMTIAHFAVVNINTVKWNALNVVHGFATVVATKETGWNGMTNYIYRF
jgi:hypothetical protein